MKFTLWLWSKFFSALYIFGCTKWMWKFPGQGWNPRHSRDHAGPSTCWATRKLPLSFYNANCRQSVGCWKFKDNQTIPWVFIFHMPHLSLAASRLGVSPSDRSTPPNLHAHYQILPCLAWIITLGSKHLEWDLKALNEHPSQEEMFITGTGRETWEPGSFYPVSQGWSFWGFRSTSEEVLAITGTQIHPSALKRQRAIKGLICEPKQIKPTRQYIEPHSLRWY